MVGLLSVQGIGAKDISHSELLYVLALLAGFSERFTLKMIDKLMIVLTSLLFFKGGKAVFLTIELRAKGRNAIKGGDWNQFHEEARLTIKPFLGLKKMI